MTPRVFICNDNGLDFHKAEKFGHLVVLTKGSIDVFRPHVAQKQIEDILQGSQFDARFDMLLVAGANLAVGFAFSWLTLTANDHKNDDKVTVKLLIFNAKEADYMVRTIQL